jgi:hypothetical protein
VEFGLRLWNDPDRLSIHNERGPGDNHTLTDRHTFADSDHVSERLAQLHGAQPRDLFAARLLHYKYGVGTGGPHDRI